MLASDLIDEVKAQLAGFGDTADRFTTLANDFTSTSDTTFQVDVVQSEAMGIVPSVVEIDSELLFVQSVDPTTGICTVAHGVGRGYRDTTPAPHTAGTAVIVNPRYPRTNVLTAMNDVLGGVFPDIVAVQTYTTTVTYPSNSYTLPSRPMKILEAQWQDPIGRWLPLSSYTIDQYDGSFRLWDAPLIGRPMRITYSTQPTQFSSENDDWSVTGMPVTSEDVIRLGACARLAAAADLGRTQIRSVEQGQRSKDVQPNAGLNVSSYFEKKFQDRLANESKSQRQMYFPKIRRTY